MTKKLMTSALTNVTPPVYFADQPAALLLGAAVSKITFGSEGSDDEMYPRPVVTVVMPTVALLQLVNDLKKQLDSASFKKHAATILGKHARTISEGGDMTPPSKMIELGKSAPSKKSSAVKKQQNSNP